MYVPVVIIVALLQILAKRNNYNINVPKDPDFDIRVRREAKFPNRINYQSEILNRISRAIKNVDKTDEDENNGGNVYLNDFNHVNDVGEVKDSNMFGDVTVPNDSENNNYKELVNKLSSGLNNLNDNGGEKYLNSYSEENREAFSTDTIDNSDSRNEVYKNFNIFHDINKIYENLHVKNTIEEHLADDNIENPKDKKDQYENVHIHRTSEVTIPYKKTTSEGNEYYWPNISDNFVSKYIPKNEKEVKEDEHFEDINEFDKNKLHGDYENINKNDIILEILNELGDTDELQDIYIIEEEEVLVDGKRLTKFTKSEHINALPLDGKDKNERRDTLKTNDKIFEPNVKPVNTPSDSDKRAKKIRNNRLLFRRKNIYIDNTRKVKDEHRLNTRTKNSTQNSVTLANMPEAFDESLKTEKPSTNGLQIPLSIGNRIKRHASQGNIVSNFFSNIYNKVYNITHSNQDNNKKDIDDTANNNIHNLNLNDNVGYNVYNQYGNNHNNHDGITHRAYTNGYSQNYPGYTAYAYNKDINKYNYPINNNGYGHNKPENSIRNNLYSYSYNQYNTDNGYGYNTASNSYNSGIGYSYNPSEHNGFINSTARYGYPYNIENGYGYNTPKDGSTSNNMPNTVLPDNSFGYNSTDKVSSNTTDMVIVPGCIFCRNFGCGKSYKWNGFMCAPKKP